MNFLRMLGIEVLFMILLIRVMIFTESNAWEKSIAISVVLWGGLFLLNPFMMGSIIECRAVVVECLVLKPCWCEHC